MGKRKKAKNIFNLKLEQESLAIFAYFFFYQTEGMCFIPKTDNDAIHLSKDVLGVLQVGF